MKNFDFVGKRKIFYIISGAFILVGLIINLIFGVKLDIDFTGGTLLRYGYEGELKADVVESVVLEELPEATVEVSDDTILITMTTDIDVETQTTFIEILEDEFPDNEIEELETSAPQASYGRTFFLKCWVAIALASLLVVLFVGFRFRKIGGFSAAVMALAALLHDVVLAYFVFVIFRIPLNDNFMAVVLTILGYSLNDTIVIYDRIRENRRKMDKTTPIAEIVNVSVGQSFSRTLNTSICTLLAIGTVAVFALATGTDDVVSFALPMSAGVIFGFYSSTFLSAPSWSKWVERIEAKKALAKKQGGKKKR